MLGPELMHSRTMMSLVPMQAEQVYQQFLQKLRDRYVPSKVSEGSFGAMMQVTLVNDVSTHHHIRSPI